MPSASNELRDLMMRWFDGALGCEEPSAFLQSRGYTLNDDWIWTKPTGAHRISEEEKMCLFFLIDEWDYGGCRAQSR